MRKSEYTLKLVGSGATSPARQKSRPLGTADISMRPGIVEFCRRNALISLTARETLYEHVFPAAPPFGIEVEIMRAASGWALGFCADFHAFFVWEGVSSMRPHTMVRLDEPDDTRRYKAARSRKEAWYVRESDWKLEIAHNGVPEMTVDPVILINRNMFTTIRIISDVGVDTTDDAVDSSSSQEG